MNNASVEIWGRKDVEKLPRGEVFRDEQFTQS
jgi:hypothetical protein